jgi:hypothetical protein
VINRKAVYHETPGEVAGYAAWGQCIPAGIYAAASTPAGCMVKNTETHSLLRKILQKHRKFPNNALSFQM